MPESHFYSIIKLYYDLPFACNTFDYQSDRFLSYARNFSKKQEEQKRGKNAGYYSSIQIRTDFRNQV